jgi:hypothetical protein
VLTSGQFRRCWVIQIFQQLRYIPMLTGIISGRSINNITREDRILKQLIILLSVLILLLPAPGCSEAEEERIKEKEDFQPEEPENFIFVGMINENPGLYKYSIDEKQYFSYWSSPNEKVVELSSSPDHSVSYFLTAGDFGQAGSVPYINGVKLYYINGAGQVSLVEQIGSGLQIISFWDDNYRLVINSVDKKNPAYLIQRKMIYNSFGRKLSDEEVTYDITGQEFPFTTHASFNTISPDGNHKIIVSGKGKFSVNISDRKNQKSFIGTVSFPLNEIIWKYNHVFLSASGPADPEEDDLPELIIYSINRKKIIQRWKGKGIRNFIINGYHIVFDIGIKENSHLIIFDYKSGKIFDEIKADKGSGIRNILF